MVRFAGIEGNNIRLVSDKTFACSNYSVVEIPDSLNNVSNTEMMIDYRLRDGYFISKYGKKEAKDIRLALIANYGDSCGIATFSKYLFEEVVGLVGDYKIFTERNQKLNLDSKNIPKDKVLPCWKRGEQLSELITAVKQYDPDIVLIEHEFGIFPNGRHWLSLLTQLNTYRVIVELHSTFPHHRDKVLFEAAIEEAVVHLQGAKDSLKLDKELNTKVHLIGHGCYPIIKQDKLWNNYKSKHTFIQQGFNFKYKNFEACIEATSLLKNKYPDIFFTALLSESPHNKIGHQISYNELALLVEKLDLQENVALIRGYQSDIVLDTFLRSNRVAVFPYLETPGHEVFGASGAARLAMASGIPVITSNIPHFSDLPTIKINTAEDIASAIDKLFLDDQLIKSQISIQNEFISKNNWCVIARKYMEIFTSSM
jgi:glycosyltransferase involved in cell wall biosynthesis